MNKDQIKGAARDVVGKVQQQAGKLAGSRKQQAKGLVKRISGKLQKGIGDARELLENAAKNRR
jgi:uncharacterized protein YjbJ (UPF0337 family)